MEENAKKVIGSTVRTGAAIVAGALIARGLPPELVNSLVDPAAAALTGTLVAGAVYGWSLLEKFSREYVRKKLGL